jgi:hypothetical protein
VNGFGIVGEFVAACVWTPATVLVLAKALGLVLLYTGLSKIRRPMPAAIALTNFSVTRGVKRPAGLLLGLVEALVGASLILSLDAVAPFAAMIMFVLFTGALAKAWANHAEFSCSCFGRGEGVINGLAVTRASTCAVAAAFVAAWTTTRQVLLLPFPQSSQMRALEVLLGLVPSLILAICAVPLIRWNSPRSWMRTAVSMSGKEHA